MATKIKAGYHKTIDGGKDFKYKFSSKPDKRGLCHECEQIPFSDYLPSACTPPRSQTSTPSDESTVFCLKLEDIVAHHHWCKFCGLLYKSICRPEYDLFKDENISKHLKTSEKLKDIKTFEQWVTTFSTWEKWTEGEDIWPFGYTRDQKEAAKEAEATAMELFRSAEDRDLKAGTVDSMYETDDTLGKALQIGTLAVGFGGLAKPGRAWAGGQMVMSHMAIFGMGRAKALPCLFMVQAYPRGEEKDGVLSVRVFAHGRAPRAPLKEISHFSLRLEQSEPRPQGAQLWYGRTLKPRIDIPFFEKCLAACHLLHGDTCGKFSWPSSQLDQQTIDRKFPIRFIDVQRMQIVQENFSRIIQPAPDPDHRSYVVLSYTWGHQEWTEHKDPEGRPYWYNWTTEESTYTPSGHTRLRGSNISSLMRPGSLNGDNVYIPKTIRDAIQVCKRMGEEYLWVDSLCIIQDEGDPDLHANLARMGRIYSEALFTIVAADAPGADAGMKGVTTDRVVSDQVIDTVKGEVQLFLPIGMQQSFDPWESRAWTFQEKLLSKRMLIIASGYAIWRCRGGIWREDVNARDGNSESASFPWLQLKLVPKLEESLEKAGLRFVEEDESVRLYRLPAFYQYVKVVEDFTRRDIGESWKILDAFEGLQRVLAAPGILDSSFRYGLPTKFMDTALLWQPQGLIRRRSNKEDGGGNFSEFSPPSWSWAGWESIETGSKGANISFDKPFDVQADEKGLIMRPNQLGEERIRPLHRSVYGVKELVLQSGGSPSYKLVDHGLLNQRGVLSQVARDWESFPQILRPALPPQGLVLQNLSDRHLVFYTAVASIWLGHECFRVKIRSKIGETEIIREELQDEDPVARTANGASATPELDQEMTVSQERWILDAKSSKRVGTVKLHSGANPTNMNTCNAVTAMVLSEAQYLGNEERVDVFGYPLYNIMVVEKREDRFAERIGLGKMFKSAWKKAGPRQETIILE